MEEIPPSNEPSSGNYEKNEKKNLSLKTKPFKKNKLWLILLIIFIITVIAAIIFFIVFLHKKKMKIKMEL